MPSVRTCSEPPPTPDVVRTRSTPRQGTARSVPWPSVAARWSGVTTSHSAAGSPDKLTSVPTESRTGR